MPIKAVIFDMDGVIINSEKLWDRAMTDVLAKYGAVYCQRCKDQCMGKSIYESAVIKKEMYGLKIDENKLAQENLVAALSLYHKLDFMPGFLSLFESLKNRNVRMCIATASDKILMDAVDKKLNLTDLFLGNVVFRQAYHKSKPAPDIFLDAAKKLGVKAEECVVIEDSPNGVDAALAAGMKVIALSGSTTHDKLIKADIVIDSLEKLNHNMIGLLGLI
ncbi:MAG: HAD family phosphatase [Candidatus Woesearchaeota archaeon]